MKYQEQVRPWIAYKDLILAFFETSNPYTSKGELHFYIIDSKEKTQRKIFVPEELQANYIDLYVKNDTVYTTEYWDQNTYYFDFHSYEWVKTRKGDDLIYEDEDYYVTSLDFGEWGGCTWFIDKKTQSQFEIGITTPIINYFEGDYFIEAGRTVYRLSDPTDLKRSDSPYGYEKVVGNLIGEGSFFAPSNSLEGLEIMFQDTTSHWEYRFLYRNFIYRDEPIYTICA
ncbi:MAG: hypothetical protein U5L96_12055 [Owenweeksia sp.]|nr:hypothetical protein [Owenweeksia sp.]